MIFLEWWEKNFHRQVVNAQGVKVDCTPKVYELCDNLWARGAAEAAWDAAFEEGKLEERKGKK